MMKHWGMSVSIDLYKCDEKIISDIKEIEKFTITLCKLLKVKRYGEPQIVHFGYGKTEGFSMVQLIETSLVSGHFANKTNAAYIDIFSCKKFDADKAAKFSRQFFRSKAITINEQIRA